MESLLSKLCIYMYTWCILGIFPEPDKDPVIQIANMVIRQGEKDPFIRNVFTLKQCASIVGAEVLSFENEDKLLKVCYRFNHLKCISEPDAETIMVKS